ncbi:MAG: ferritin [Desulfuromonadales bacterium]|nr:MAG: ferritin [Desulfuromonadales bacterium]
MLTDTDVQEAIRKSIQTEKNAMNFYELGARQMKDPDAIRVFETLAKEEREHASHFYRIYKGGDLPEFNEFMNAPPDHESTWMAALAKTINSDFNEQKAMELAMEKELNLESALRETAARIENTEVREIFELNARETRNHYEMIESEYARIMAMVHESDMDTYVRE